MITNTDTRLRVRLKDWVRIEDKRCTYEGKAYGILSYVSERICYLRIWALVWSAIDWYAKEL